MPHATIEEQKALGLVPPPPGVPEIDPETKAVKLAKIDHSTFRKLMSLTDDQKVRIKKLLKDSYQEWKSNTQQQNSKLRRAITRLEGITTTKSYPWPNSSNLNIPYMEIQILVAADIAGSTMIEADPMYFVKELLPARKDRPEEKVDPKIEWWLNWVIKNQLHLDDDMRMAILLAFRDPVAFLVTDWVEDLPKEYRVQIFETLEELQSQFPDAASAKVKQEVYDSWVGQVGVAGEPLALEIEERVVRYRGPKLRVVELKDFVRSPVSSPDIKYTIFHGDQFRQRKAWFLAASKRKWFYSDETKKMLDSAPQTKAMDDISQQLDVIEGITSNRTTPDEYDCIRGNLQIDLNGDDEEELYHVVYNPETDSLLRCERYPYWHNRSNYIPFRIRRKPNRLLGRCFVDMLYDISEEINTQHNQRIDSRTITTVPSFKINANETDLIENMARNTFKFFPGCRFILSNVNNLEQLETKVDFSGTLQEEQNLMAIGDMLTGTGSSGVRSGREASKDPRASGKKTNALLSQSNQRIDGYVRELRPSMNETGAQVIELYYQFSPDSVIQYASYDQTTGDWITNEIKRTQLRNRNMTVELARISVTDSPDAILQRAMTDYQLWKDEPLVGGNLSRRWELIRDTMFAERKKNIPKLLPPLDVILKEMEKQDQMRGGSQSHDALLEGVNANPSDSKEDTGKRQGGADHRPEQLDRSKKG